MAQWTREDPTYSQRVAFLTGTSGGANGLVFLIAGTTGLNDSNAKDTSAGGLGSDLFFSFGGDRVMDKESGESVL